MITFTKFLRKRCGREFLQFPHCGVTVWKNKKFSRTKKIFRQINSLVTYLVKPLNSRNCCQKSFCVRFYVKSIFFFEFQSVKIVANEKTTDIAYKTQCVYHQLGLVHREQCVQAQNGLCDMVWVQLSFVSLDVLCQNEPGFR